MDVEALIAGVGELLRLPALRLNEQGVCRLAVDNDLIVDIEHDGAANVLHIYSSLGPLPAGGREAVYEAPLLGFQSSRLIGSMDFQQAGVIWA